MIKVKVLAHSVSPSGQELLTFELEYHRFIHSEFMTHRVFSRNAASSRAIPIGRMIDLVEMSPATPIHWGANQSGMQAEQEIADRGKAIKSWGRVGRIVVKCAKFLDKLGLHKQIVNRILEPFQMIKVVVTATEWDNFVWLRDHKDAQPEIAQLAKLMWEAKEASVPMELWPGNWHLPYVECIGNGYDLSMQYYVGGVLVDLTFAKKYSAACCAAVSYRTDALTTEAANRIYKQLIESEPCHASPVEHQATPIECHGVPAPKVPHPYHWEEGITHMDREMNFWSNNFKGWIQHRALIPNNVCNNYERLT